MKVLNDTIAKKFFELADLLEINGENPFRVRAYRNAARTISSLGKSLSELTRKDEDLTKFAGIGKDLAEKIKEIVETGELKLLKQTKKKVPHFLSELMTLEGLGPKRVKVIHSELNIKSIKDLEKAIKEKKMQKLKGFGEGIAKKILAGIKHKESYGKRIRLFEAWPMAHLIYDHLLQLDVIDKIEIAGSFRRRKETVGDLDILVATNKNTVVMDHFLKFDHINRILVHGNKKASVRLSSGLQVDLRLIDQKSFAAALLYFTGSKDHNVALRKMALDKDYKLNEYGLFKGKRNIGGKTEASIYTSIGLSYIEPELREMRGEIQAVKANRLPNLITLKDIKGDLHAHTNETDGMDTLENMAKAAKKQGFKYLAISDHSKHLRVAKGLDEKRLRKQIRLIDKLNEKLKGITILKSMEVDILKNGTLDLSEGLLKELDLTVCSIHSNFNLSATKQTERILKAMDNKYFSILAHPTGRLINKRPPLSLHLEKIIQAAKEKNCIMEINAQPERLDLNDIYIKTAKEMGVKFAISTDAHNTTNFDYMKFGIFQARRGWLEKKDVINTRSLARLKKLLKR